MDFKDVLAQLSRITSPLHKSQSCHLEQGAILQYSVLLDAAKDGAFFGRTSVKVAGEAGVLWNL